MQHSWTGSACRIRVVHTKAVRTDGPDNSIGGALRGNRRRSSRETITRARLRSRRRDEQASPRIERKLLQRPAAREVQTVLPERRGGKDPGAERNSLHNLVRWVVVPHVVPVQQEQVAFLAAADDQMGYRPGGLINKHSGATRTEIRVVGRKRGLVRRRKPICDGKPARGVEF